jgi:hypothetical protein
LTFKPAIEQVKGLVLVGVRVSTQFEARRDVQSISENRTPGYPPRPAASVTIVTY